MNTLADIESAATTLTEAEEQELLLFLATSLRRQRAQLPPLRRFSIDMMRAWIAEDEADFGKLSRGN